VSAAARPVPRLDQTDALPLLVLVLVQAQAQG
jgi:hypothetical protein